MLRKAATVMSNTTNAHDPIRKHGRWNLLHIITSGQRMLRKAAADMGNITDAQEPSRYNRVGPTDASAVHCTSELKG